MGVTTSRQPVESAPSAEGSSFQVRLFGEGVSPATVRAGDLADFVTDLEAAILGGRASGAPVDDGVVVSLIRIEEGSNKLTFAVSKPFLPVVGALTLAVASGDFRAIPPKSHVKLEEISKQAVKKRWAVEFLAEPDKGLAGGVISETAPIPAPHIERVTGPTTIRGRLHRIGGTKPIADLRLPDGEILKFRLTKAMAKQLSDGLYEEVAIEGIGSWALPDRQLLEFRALRITSYRPEQSSIASTFAELASLSAGLWDDIDAAGFVADLRAEDAR